MLAATSWLAETQAPHAQTRTPSLQRAQAAPGSARRGGGLTFAPSELDVTLGPGETAVETVTISNDTGSPVSFEFPQYSGGTRRARPLRPNGPALKLGKGERDPRVGSAPARGAGGPDGFGYTWIDSDEPGGPTYDFIDIAATGDPGPTDDDEGLTVALPFSFPFYGVDHTEVTISTNGYLTFGPNGTDFLNQPIPTADEPNDLVAPFWDDLNPLDGGAIYYQDMGDGRFVVQWDEIPPQFSEDAAPYTFEVILYASGQILYQYEDMQGDLLSATVGIENPDGTDGLEVVFNAPYVHDGLAVLIQEPRPVFVSDVDPASGTIPAGGSVDVDVTFDADGLDPATYTGTLLIETDLDGGQTFDYPVALTVTPLDFSVSPGALSFEVEKGSASDPQTLTLTNNGPDEVTFSISTVITVPAPVASPAPAAPMTPRPRRGNPAKLLDGPMPPTPGTPYFGGDIVQDGSFEAGTPNPSWEEESTNFGTPLCDVDACGDGGGTGPRTGDWWVWFGGVIGVQEDGSVEQDVTIPDGSATLTFWLEIPAAGTTGFMSVQLDGDEVFRVTEADSTAYATYQEVTVDISAYADGGTHALRFESTTDAGDGRLNFFVDDVAITAEAGTFLVVDPESGTVGPGDSEEISVVADATDVTEVGTYTAEIRITSDTPSSPLIVVPVTIVVTERNATEGAGGLPTSFAVSGSYPNPASALTTIRYALPEAARVRVEVYDVTGRRVALLLDAEQAAAFHEVSWDASALAAGLYVCRVQAGARSEAVKVVVAR